MIADIFTIQQIIKDNPSKGIIDAGIELNKKLRRQLYGVDLDKSKIQGFEWDDLHKIREKYSKTNKDLCARVLRPLDKVYSARGGTVYYNVSQEQDKKARQIASNIIDGYSIRKWIKEVWNAHMIDDPFGLLFMEMLPKQEAILAKKAGVSFVYPTYKSITSIYDYKLTGNKLEYVVFKLETEEKKMYGIDPAKIIYRFVDDAFDYIVEREGENVSILTAFTLQNYFGYVPGMVNSDILDPEKEGHYKSLFSDVLELSEQYWYKGSIKVAHEFLHGFPKYWQYVPNCTPCNGTGKANAVDKCEHCHGTGKMVATKVNQAILLGFPDKEDTVVTPDVAGYVSPDKTYWEISTTDSCFIEDLMKNTLWGTQNKQTTQGMSISGTGDAKTATEIMADIKPESDRLEVVSEMAEIRHKFILDAAIQINLNLPNYPGSSVKYGRRYMIESPDEIFAKYDEARKAGSPVSVLNEHLTDYYESKYQGDEIGLAIALKLMDVEPFVHYTVQQVEASTSITNQDKAAKVYFSEWYNTKVNDAMLLSMSVELLRDQLMQYAKEKSIISVAETAAKQQPALN